MWYHKIPVSLWLTALSMIISRSICVVASGIISFFLMFKITLCVCVYIYTGEGNGNPLQYSCLEIPWTEEPGRLQSMGSQRVRHDWVTSLSLALASRGTVLVAQSCPTLCDPMDYSLPGFSVHRIHQARLLEWVAIPFSRGSSRPRDWTTHSALHAESIYLLSHQVKTRGTWIL